MAEYCHNGVARQSNGHLSAEDLSPRNQFAYRKQHSTETALIRVLSDALAAADRQRVTLLGLLDLSAAFDCVDHTLLLQRLEHQHGLTGVVLQRLTSFIRHRSDPAGRIRRATVISSTVQFRRAARVGLGSAAVRDVHS